MDIRDSSQVCEGKAKSRKNLKYGPKDFERVLTAMRRRRVPLMRSPRTGTCPAKAQYSATQNPTQGLERSCLETTCDIQELLT